MNRIASLRPLAILMIALLEMSEARSFSGSLN